MVQRLIQEVARGHVGALFNDLTARQEARHFIKWPATLEDVTGQVMEADNSRATCLVSWQAFRYGQYNGHHGAFRCQPVSFPHRLRRITTFARSKSGNLIGGVSLSI